MTAYLRCLTLFLAAGLITGSQGAEPTRCLIERNSIFGIHQGVTLGAIKARDKSIRLSRTSDGDGASLIVVHRGGQDLLLVAVDDEGEGPIDLRKQAAGLETFSPLCQTREGVGPGLSIRAAADIYGPVESIVESEIEARQYVRFKHQPAGLEFRIDNSCLFAGNRKRTRQYRPEGKILSVLVP